MATTTGTTATNPCLQLQEAIGRYFAVTPAGQQYSTGSIDALKSAQNTAGVALQLVDGDGARPTSTSNRNIQMRYVPKTCEESGVTWSECSYGSPQAPLWKTADVTVNRSVDFGFDLTESDYRDMCETLDDGYMAFSDAKYADAKQRLNNLAIVDLVGAMGTYPISGNNSVTTPVTAPVITAKGVYNPGGLALIKSAYNQMNIMAEPIVVGAGKLDMVTNSYAYSGLADTGVNGGTSPLRYFRDPNVNSSFFNDGDDHALTWTPGAIQMAEWYEYIGLYDKREDFYINGKLRVKKDVTTIVTPDGLTWDFLYVYDCGVHKYRFRKQFGITTLPADAFGACQDFNYALHYLLGCGDLTCEQIAAGVGPGAQSG